MTDSHHDSLDQIANKALKAIGLTTGLLFGFGVFMFFLHTLAWVLGTALYPPWTMTTAIVSVAVAGTVTALTVLGLAILGGLR